MGRRAGDCVQDSDGWERAQARLRAFRLATHVARLAAGLTSETWSALSAILAESQAARRDDFIESCRREGRDESDRLLEELKTLLGRPVGVATELECLDQAYRLLKSKGFDCDGGTWSGINADARALVRRDRLLPLTVNQRLLLATSEMEPGEMLDVTQRALAERLDCAPSTIAGTAVWKMIVKARAEERASRKKTDVTVD